MKSPQKQDAPQLLPASRITGILNCIPVLVQEEAALVRRQLIGLAYALASALGITIED